MLTTNQVPFIAQVLVIPYGWAMNVPNITPRVIQHKSRLTHLTSKVLKVNKIKNTKHVGIKH